MRPGELIDFTAPVPADVNGRPVGDSAERDSWSPLDLGPYLRGEVKRAEPTLGAMRQDGVRFLYPGLEHVVIGEMESGKSWFALMCVAMALHDGGRVVYVHFEEDDPSDTVERLLLLGVSTSRIAAGLDFVGPERPITAEDVARLTEVPPALAVLDGVNEAMALHGYGIMDPDGAAAYRRHLVRPFTRLGAAALSCDHVVKDPDRNGQGYAFGSIHKGNGLNGALFLIENTEPFGRGRRGASHVFVTKDRPAHLRRAGKPTAVPRKFYVSTLIVDATGEHLSYVLTVPKADESSAAGSDAGAGRVEADVLTAVEKLTGNDVTPSMSKIVAEVKGRATEVRLAVERLHSDGVLREERRGQARLFHIVEQIDPEDRDEDPVPSNPVP